MNANGLALVVLIALMTVNVVVWIAYAHSPLGATIATLAVLACVKVHRWAFE